MLSNTFGVVTRHGDYDSGLAPYRQGLTDANNHTHTHTHTHIHGQTTSYQYTAWRVSHGQLQLLPPIYCMESVMVNNINYYLQYAAWTVHESWLAT